MKIVAATSILLPLLLGLEGGPFVLGDTPLVEGESSSANQQLRGGGGSTAALSSTDSPVDRSLKTHGNDSGGADGSNSNGGSSSVGSGKKRFVVKYRNEAGKAKLLEKADRNVYHDFAEDNLLVVDLDDDELMDLVLRDDIEDVEEDHVYEELGHFVRELDVTKERHLAEQTPYGITMVQGNQVSFGSNRVKVCVTDTGVARGHPDLPSNMQGASRTSSISRAAIYWYNDVRGHGTHTAGTIAARKGNGVGVVGVAPGADLYITRALDDSGAARESDIYEAVKQCGQAGAKIISMSLGGGGLSSSFKSLIDKLYYEQGILFVAASGNNGSNGLKYPAAHPTVVAVGALSSNYALWGGSNWGSGTELVAPGDLVLSTTINGRGEYVYSLYSGTSMAAPHVAGVAALLWSHYPKCSNDQIRFAMAYTAKDLDDSSSDSSRGCDIRFGNGLVQAKAALDFLGKYSCSSGSWGRNADLGGCSVLK